MAIVPLAPSNEMFTDGICVAGLDLLSRLQIREGMALCVAVIQPDRWGLKDRMKGCLKSLQRYGTHAKEVLPKLKETRTYLATVKKAGAETLAEFDKAIATIENSTATPTLVNLADFKTRPAK